MKIVTVEEMRGIEQSADAGGLSYQTMMENAGRAVAEAIGQWTAMRGHRVLVLVGPGNNGGDGLVAAHYLHEMGADVACYVWKRRARDDENLDRVVEDQVPLVWMKDDGDLAKLRANVAEAEVVVDALLGTGASRPIKGALKVLLDTVKEVLEELAGAPPPALVSPAWPSVPPDPPFVVAIDLPSGLNADTGDLDPSALPADLTVTFACPKRGQFLFPGTGAVGQLVVADIGVPEELTAQIDLELITAETVRGLLPPRPLHAHKGTFGKAMIVAGSVNYTGAPALAAAAATRVGAGLVTLAPPRVLHGTLAAAVTEPTFLLLPHDMGVLAPAGVKILAEKLPGYRALLIGPGLTTEKPTAEFVEAFFEQAGEEQPRRRGSLGFLGSATGELEEQGERERFELPPLVVDADALNILAGFEKWWERVPANSILTPHPGEMARLMDQEADRDAIQADRWGTARRMAKAWNQVVALKGAFTVVAAPDGRVDVSPFANPGLASGGTGDVLAGAIVGLLAQGLAPFDAAVAGVYLHGLAGELVRAELGNAGMVASDLLPALPDAISLLK
jgi:NAD(P)H-hydrate epimerase